jgi:hypothetical protein
MRAAGWWFAPAVAALGCGAQGTSPAQAPSPVVSGPVDVELGTPNSAQVHGQRIAFDGEPDGLAWPNLDRALARKPGDAGSLTLAVARDAKMRDVLRAAWTLRNADLRLQTSDASGKARALVFRARSATPAAGCHVALFVGDEGRVRLASAAGAETANEPNATAHIVQSVDGIRTHCPIRYVAFGAESSDASWGMVFDLAVALDDAKAAGSARYVLGEPLRRDKALPSSR